MTQTMHSRRQVVRCRTTPNAGRAQHSRVNRSAGERGQRVITIRGQTTEDEARQFVHDALRELHAFIREHDLQTVGAPFALVNHTSAAPEMLDVEAGWPIDGPAASSGRIHAGTLPRPIIHCPHKPAPDAIGSVPVFS
jgi:hypothetical protein